MASFADARARNGRWLVRIEDVDEPRSQPHAAELILRTLTQYGFAWDGEVVVQSQRKTLYENALIKLRAMDVIFACACTRKMLETAPQNVSGERLYPGTCAALQLPSESQLAIRAHVPDETIAWNDRLLGPQSQHLATDVGAFIVKRSDGLFAYQIAVVADDADQGITHIVRGADLLTSTARQIYLQRLLGAPTPAYLHIPVAVNGRGEKLSKQTLAPALDETDVLPTLHRAWRALQQPPAPASSTVAEFWMYAQKAWSIARLPRMLTMPELNSS